jgi:hypothetical protein
MRLTSGSYLPLDHAVHGGLRKPGLPRSASRRAAGRAAYMRGGRCEPGGSQQPIAEGKFYQEIPGPIPGVQLLGHSFKQLMRTSILRDRLAGINFIGTDLPYLTNNGHSGPQCHRPQRQPVPRITGLPKPSENTRMWRKRFMCRWSPQ